MKVLIKLTGPVNIQLSEQLVQDGNKLSKFEHEAAIAEITRTVKSQASQEAKLRIEEAKEQWRKESKEYAKRETWKLTEQYEAQIASLQ